MAMWQTRKKGMRMDRKEIEADTCAETTVKAIHIANDTTNSTPFKNANESKKTH